MTHQDYEHESAKDSIYLLEEMELLKAEFMRDFEREEAIIKVFENPIENGNKELANIQRTTPEGIQSGSDIPTEHVEEPS